MLLSFSRSLSTKFLSLHNEPHIIRPILIDLNPVKLYPFMISLDNKCNGSCNVFDDLSTKISLREKTKRCMIKYLI